MDIVYTDPIAPGEGSEDEQLTERGPLAEEVTKSQKGAFNIFRQEEEKKSDANLPGETPQFPQPKK